MTIRVNAVDYTVKNPFFGYTTIIDMATEVREQDNGKYIVWDHGQAFDSRRCICNWLLSKSETLTLIQIFQDVAKGRGVDLEMTPDSGFFPFGPDKGDDGASGPFTVRVLRIDAGPSIGHPEDFWNTEVEFIHNGSYPSYTPPAEVAEGSLEIGTVSGLRYPEGMHTQAINYDIRTAVSYGGNAHTIDKTLTADAYVSTLAMGHNEGNAAALLAHVQDTVRANDVTITPPANAFLFGREKTAPNYLCKLIQSEITVIHERHNLFNMDMTFYRIADGE